MTEVLQHLKNLLPEKNANAERFMQIFDVFIDQGNQHFTPSWGGYITLERMYHGEKQEVKIRVKWLMKAFFMSLKSLPDAKTHQEEFDAKTRELYNDKSPIMWMMYIPKFERHITFQAVFKWKY